MAELSIGLCDAIRIQYGEDVLGLAYRLKDVVRRGKKVESGWVY
jgi:hypothetical protein